MIALNKIPGENCVKLPYSDLVDGLPIEGWQMEDLGAGSDGVHLKGLYRDINTSKPVIFLNSSVHGDEWQSTFWNMQFAQYISRPNLAPPHASPFFEMLKNKYSWYWIPVASPSGYSANTRVNSNGININETFHTQSQPENVIISNKVLELKPVMLIDSHTWDDPSTPCHGIGYYTQYKDRAAYRQFLSDILSTIQYATREEVLEYPGHTHDGSRLRSWAALQGTGAGGTCMAFLVEADKLASNQIQTTQGVNALLAFCLYFDSFFSKQILNPVF